MKKDLHFNFEGYICNNPENVQHKIFSIPEKYSFSCSVFLAKIILFISLLACHYYVNCQNYIKLYQTNLTHICKFHTKILISF